MTKHQRQRGFSLAEVLIASFIIVVALAGVTASLTYGVKNSTRGREISESTQLASTLFEYIQGNGLIDSVDRDEEWPAATSGINDLEDTRRLLNEAPFRAVTFTPHQVTRFRRNIRVESLGDDHRQKLARVTVTVTWEDSQGEHKTELIGVVRHVRSQNS